MLEGESVEALKRRLLLYRRIIERYREVIEQAEAKSAAELKNLVSPGDEAVLAVKERIASAFRPYIPEKDFEEAAGRAFEFVRSEIASERLPLAFWLRPKDILELRAADEMDKAVFLCSLLLALENDSARVVVASDHETRSFVAFEWKGIHHLFDPARDIRLAGERGEVLAQHRKAVGWSRLAYEFNNHIYEEHSE